jgi:MFS family permease
MLLAAAVIAAVALTKTAAVAIGATFFLGVAWIAVLATLNGTVQAVLPNWVRGRGLSIYLTVQGGAMFAGSLAWGLVADRIGTSSALLVAALALTALAAVTAARRIALPKGESDLDPSLHWAEPELSAPLDQDRGPVIVTVTYRVVETDRPAFLDVLTSLSEERREGRRIRWGISEDAADRTALSSGSSSSPGRNTCASTAGSRSRCRPSTKAARPPHGPEPPVVTHLIGIDPRRAVVAL